MAVQMKIPYILVLFGCIGLSTCQTIDLAMSSVNIDLANIKTANIEGTKLLFLVNK
ncbi:MAG: hypothetical protein ACI9C4_003215 [Paraglaciecola sp.]|jgi:hypothetical protein